MANCWQVERWLLFMINLREVLLSEKRGHMGISAKREQMVSSLRSGWERLLATI
jgi:hypothetical protein